LKAPHIPDILLLDMQMPEMNGLETMKWLNNYFPDLPVIILTACSIELTTAEFYTLGARAILQKGICEKELLKAIRHVKEEGYYCNSPSSLRTMLRINGKSRMPEPTHTKLTEKEQLLIELSATDMKWESIASVIYLSKGGIEKMCKRLFCRLGVNNRTTLALKAERNGLIPPAK
jgi:two-component system invasion response regulator UvrY